MIPALLLSVLFIPAADTNPVGQRIYEDSNSGITINFSKDAKAGVAEFTSTLPPGWTFLVAIDGNQDGIWGLGSGLNSARVSSDRQYAQEQHGIFCPQFVLSAAADNPARIQSATPCGELPSEGHVELSSPRARGWVTIAYKLPLEEVFGDKPTASVQACLWDTMRWSCQHSPKEPAIIKR